MSTIIGRNNVHKTRRHSSTFMIVLLIYIDLATSGKVYRDKHNYLAKILF